MSMVPVEGLLCLVEENADVANPELQPVPGLMVGGVDPVLEHAARPGPLDRRGVQWVYDLLVPAMRDDQQLLVPKAWSTKARNLARLVALAVVGAFLMHAGLSSMDHHGQSPRLTRAQLQGQVAHWRKVAKQRAGGAVHGPRVTATHDTFQLTFKRRPRCVVRLDVPRARGARAHVRSKNCR
jgi:hypothetical protein